jgi:hypothetical protein
MYARGFLCFALTFILAGNVFGMEYHEDVLSQENKESDEAKVAIVPIAVDGCSCEICGEPVDEKEVKVACCLARQLCKESPIKCCCGGFYHKKCFEEVFYHKNGELVQNFGKIATDGLCLKCDKKLSTCMQRYIRCSSKYCVLLVSLSYLSALAAMNLGLEKCLDGYSAGCAAAGVCGALALPSIPKALDDDRRAAQDEHASVWKRWGKWCVGLTLMYEGIVITFLVHKLT